MRDLLNIVDNILNEAANPALIQAVEKAGLQTKSKGNLLVGLVQIPDKAKKNEFRANIFNDLLNRLTAEFSVCSLM